MEYHKDLYWVHCCILYVNDIDKSSDANILSFADETSVFMSHSNPTILFRDANRSINELFNWFCANKLSLNPQKTKYIIIHPLGRPIDFANMNISIWGSTLTRIGSTAGEQSTKFLSLYMDESLTWKHHIAHIKSKISRALFIIKQVRYILPKESLTKLYFSLKSILT